MFDRVVIGVDPGTAATGLAVVAGGEGGAAGVIEAATIRTGAHVAEAGRLLDLHRGVAAALRQHKPEGVAVERLLWGRNVGSAMGVARATGVVLLAAAEAGVPVYEYAPLEVKLSIAGDGSAAKSVVRRALERIHGVADVPRGPDAADAVAVAVCHLHQARALRRVSVR
jgi:crossover junction endodeoxyribonuclease RuvC